MSDYKIQIGDMVAVYINNMGKTVISRGEVKYMPCAAGDSWIIVDLDTSDTHYISEGCTIIKSQKDYTR